MLDDKKRKQIQNIIECNNPSYQLFRLITRFTSKKNPLRWASDEQIENLEDSIFKPASSLEKIKNIRDNFIGYTQRICMKSPIFFRLIDSENCLYIFKDASAYEDVVKIGVSTNPIDRIKILKSDRGNKTKYYRGVQEDPLKLNIVSFYDGLIYFDEYYFHWFFKRARYSGSEYFNISRFTIWGLDTINRYAKFFDCKRYDLHNLHEFNRDKPKHKTKQKEKSPFLDEQYLRSLKDGLPRPRLIKNIKYEYVYVCRYAGDLWFIWGPHHRTRVKDVDIRYVEAISKHSLVKKRPLPEGKNDWKDFQHEFNEMKKEQYKNA